MLQGSPLTHIYKRCRATACNRRTLWGCLVDVTVMLIGGILWEGVRCSLTLANHWLFQIEPKPCNCHFSWSHTHTWEVSHHKTLTQAHSVLGAVEESGRGGGFGSVLFDTGLVFCLLLFISAENHGKARRCLLDVWGWRWWCVSTEVNGASYIFRYAFKYYWCFVF